MAKIFVIAGTVEQARLWIKENLKKRMDSGVTTLSHSDYVIVDSVYRLRGVSEPHGVFIGTWKLRDDILTIVQELRIHSMHNPALAKIHTELKMQASASQVASLTASNMANEIDKQVLEMING